MAWSLGVIQMQCNHRLIIQEGYTTKYNYLLITKTMQLLDDHTHRQCNHRLITQTPMRTTGQSTSIISWQHGTIFIYTLGAHLSLHATWLCQIANCSWGRETVLHSTHWIWRLYTLVIAIASTLYEETSDVSYTVTANFGFPMAVWADMCHCIQRPRARSTTGTSAAIFPPPCVRPLGIAAPMNTVYIHNVMYISRSNSASLVEYYALQIHLRLGDGWVIRVFLSKHM